VLGRLQSIFRVRRHGNGLSSLWGMIHSEPRKRTRREDSKRPFDGPLKAGVEWTKTWSFFTFRCSCFIPLTRQNILSKNDCISLNLKTLNRQSKPLQKVENPCKVKLLEQSGKLVGDVTEPRGIAYEQACLYDRPL